MRYMLTGADWSADEAYRMGLVQEVTAPGQQLDRAIDFAKPIATAAPLGVRTLLSSAHRGLSESEKLALSDIATGICSIAEKPGSSGISACTAREPRTGLRGALALPAHSAPICSPRYDNGSARTCSAVPSSPFSASTRCRDCSCGRRDARAHKRPKSEEPNESA